MKKLLVATATAALVLGVLPAHAAEATMEDPADDVAGLMDITLISYEGKPHGLGTLTIKMDEGFSCNYLKPSYDTYLKWLFDDKEDGDYDLKGKFVCRENKLFFELKSKTNSYEPIRAKRPNTRTTIVEFPFDLIEFKSNNLGLVAKSKDGVNAECQETACVDRAPDEGQMKAY